MKTRHMYAYIAAGTLGILLAAALVFAAEGGPVVAPGFTIHKCARADSISLADYLDGPVLLFFYDGGIAPDTDALRYATEWDRRYAGDGLSIIGMHTPFFEPSKVPRNAIEIVGTIGVSFPVGLDMDGRIFDLYREAAFAPAKPAAPPAFVLIEPGGEVQAAVAGRQSYAAVEESIQALLRELNPDVILPLVMKPLRPWDDPTAEIFRPTDMVILGYAGGQIADFDSTRRDDLAEYTDTFERTRETVFLSGRWRVDEYSISHSDSAGRPGDYLRIIYRGKTVWVLPCFDYGTRPVVYLRQDRSDLSPESWGKHVMSDGIGRPYIYMNYCMPLQIVNNPAYGTHQLELIAGEGDVSFYYLFFEDDARK